MSETELDIDESMAKTLAEIREKEEIDDEDEPEAEAPDGDQPEDVDEGEGEPDTGEDDTGEITAEEEDPAEVTSEEGSEEEVDDDLGSPPTAYSAAAKDDWAKTPKSVREAAIKREQDSSRGVEMLKEKSSFGERLQQAATPYLGMIQSRGATLESFIVGQGNTMMALQSGTSDQKMSILRNMAGLAGVDLANIQPPSEVERQLSPYMQKIQQLEQQINQQTQMVTSQEDLSINQALTAFESARGDDGGLAHPYFHNVETEMVQAIPVIKRNNPHFSHAEVLQQAYDNSIWANPETRQQIQVQQDRKAEEERKRKAKETATKARKANKVNLPKKGLADSSQAEPLGSIDDTMAATMKKIKGR